MEVRKIKTKDFYETAKLWWKSHGFPIVHISLLPVYVFVVSDNNDDLYCCFFYNTDSALAYLAYPISNIKIDKEKRNGALEYLFNEIEKHARKDGYYLMYTTSYIPAVMKALEKTGYKEGDVLVNQFFKELS